MSTTSEAYRYANEGKSFYVDWKATQLWGRVQSKAAPSKESEKHHDLKSLIKVQQPRHIRKIAECLCTIPSELFWPILDGAPVGRILQLSASLEDASAFDRCIAKNSTYQYVFPSPEHLANLRNIFVLFYELRTVLDFITIPFGSPLSRIPNEFYYRDRLNYRALRDYLDTSIDRILRGQAKSERPVLGQYFEVHYQQEWEHNKPSAIAYNASSIELPNAVRDVLQRNGNDVPSPKNVPYHFPTFYAQVSAWRAGQKARMLDLVDRCPELLEINSEQRGRMADLVERYPELLKRASDPLPVSRPNWKHIANILRSNSLRSTAYALKEKRQIGRKGLKIQGAHLFRYDLFPLVPTDDSLALFVAGIAKIWHTLPADLAEAVGPILSRDPKRTLGLGNDLQGSSVVRLFAAPFSKLCLEVDEGLYPPSVLKDIRAALEGMAFVHTLPDRDTGITPQVKRTRWTPWSTEPFRGQLPVTESLNRAVAPLDSFNFINYRPVFLSPPCPHLDCLSPVKLDKDCFRFYAPSYQIMHSDQEFGWLEAFCRTVRFLEMMEHGGNFAYQRALDQQMEVDERFRRIQWKWDRRHLADQKYLEKYGEAT